MDYNGNRGGYFMPVKQLVTRQVTNLKVNRHIANKKEENKRKQY
jgi:hypothetical protein